jgi:hypothetical protein
VEIIRRLERGGCYERKKQRAKGKQEVGTENTQREEKAKEREEEQVGRTASFNRRCVVHKKVGHLQWGTRESGTEDQKEHSGSSQQLFSVKDPL